MEDVNTNEKNICQQTERDACLKYMSYGHIFTQV